MLFVTSLVDLGADIAQRADVRFWGILNYASIALSAVVAVLAGWMFFDLQNRKPG